MTAAPAASRVNPPWSRRLLGFCLAATLLLGHPLPALARKDKAPDWPQREFLPPVATINGKVDPNAGQATGEDNALEAVSLVGVNTPTLNKTPRVERLSESIKATELNPGLKTLADLQGQVDEADLNRLWEATVERNPVIRFSLEKIATPTDLQPKQSSIFLRKTLSTLISGAAMAATSMPGGGAYRDMGAMAASNALQNMVAGRTQPAPNALTPTEQIQLAGLIDELKIKLIRTYQDYKHALQALSESHAITMKNNNLYSQALASKNDLAVMAAGTAYYQALSNETALRQKAKLYRLQLERLAGPDALDDLQLAVLIPEGATPAATTPPARPTETAGLAPSTPAATETALPDEIGPLLPDAAIGPEAPVGPMPASGGKKQTARNPQNARDLQPIADKVDEGGRHDH